MGIAQFISAIAQARVLGQQAKQAKFELARLKREEDLQKEREGFAKDLGLPEFIAKQSPALVDTIGIELARGGREYQETPPFAVNMPGDESPSSVPQTRSLTDLISALPPELLDLISTGTSPLQRAQVGEQTAKASLDAQKASFLANTLGGGAQPQAPVSQNEGVAAIQNRLRGEMGATPPAMGGLPPSPAGMFDMSDPRVLMALDIAGAPLPQMMEAQRASERAEPSLTVPGGQDMVRRDAFGNELSRKAVPLAPSYTWKDNVPGPEGTLYSVPYDQSLQPVWGKAIPMQKIGKAEGEKPVGQSAKDWINPATGQNPAPTTPVSELNRTGFIPTATAPVEFQTIPASDRKNYVNIDGKSAPANLRTPAEAAKSGYELVGDPQEIQRRIQVAEARPMVIKYLKTIAKLFPLSSGGVLGQAGRLAESKYQAYKRDDPAWADFEKFKFTLIEPVARAVAKSLGAVREDDNKRAQAAMAKAGDDPAVAHSHARELARAFNIPEDQINSALGGAEPQSYQQKSYKSLWE